MSKIAFLYPGQGAQVAGMGKDFYEQSPLAKEKSRIEVSNFPYNI